MYTITESLALIFAISVIVKFAFIYSGTNTTNVFLKNSKKVYENSMIRNLYLLLFIATLYLLLMEMTIVQFTAAFTVGLLLYGHMLLHFPKEIQKIAQSYFKDRKKYLPEFFIYLILAIWVLRVLFQ